MKNRHNWSMTLVWDILLLMVLVCTPVTALAAGQTTSDTEAVSEASPDEASEQTSSEEEWAQRIAEELHQRAAEEEPAVTAFLKTMESEHAHLEGLEYRLKSIPSLCRKILLLAHKNGETPEEAKSRIGDALRYTLIIEDPFYTAVTKETLDSIINKGYTLTEFENYWANDARAYQGINCNLACPNGMIFELQFHTPISYETKGEKTHVYYEIIRDENSSPEEKEKARQKHDALFAMIPVPEGVRELSYDVEKQTQEDVESTVAETETEAIKLDPISGADIYETDDSVIVPMDSLRVTEDVTEEGVGRALSFIEK